MDAYQKVLYMENQPVIEQALRAALQVKTVEINWLAGDASDRTYYEVHTEKEHPFALMVLGEKDRILVQQGAYDWVSLQQFLLSHGLPVPTIQSIFPDLGLLLIEHLGAESLEKKIRAAKNSEEIAVLYRSIFPLVGKLLHAPQHPAYTQRKFDQALLTRELHFFRTHFLQAIAQLMLSPAEEHQFEQEVQIISAHIEAQSRFFVHRDFHSRNILFHQDGPYIIDFQDARLGSPVYDLISLLFDPYPPVSIPLRQQLFQEALSHTSQLAPQWQPVFLQRLLKILGSYGFLGHTKNASFLQYIPTTLSFLSAIPTYDPRWPFLSGELLHRMQEAQRHTA